MATWSAFILCRRSHAFVSFIFCELTSEISHLAVNQEMPSLVAGFVKTGDYLWLPMGFVVAEKNSHRVLGEHQAGNMFSMVDFVLQLMALCCWQVQCALLYRRVVGILPSGYGAGTGLVFGTGNWA